MAIPLTTNLDNKTEFDIHFNLQGRKGLIKVGSLIRLYEKNLITPFYSIKEKRY